MAAKILIIDDDASVAQMLKALLEIHGYEVSVALDGAQGLQRARQDKPDLLLLDVMLPDLGGVEVCQMLKADPKTQKAKVIMLTGLGSVADVE